MRKILNRRGPRIDPWGTPEATGIGEEYIESKVIIMERLERKLKILLMKNEGKLREINLNSRPSCQTKSKALVRSRAHATVHSLFLRLYITSF